MLEILTLIASGLTLLFTFEIYHFNSAYRRATGDKSVPYITANRWRPIALILRRHTEPGLRRLQARAVIVGLLWLLSVLALFLAWGDARVNSNDTPLQSSSAHIS